MESDQNMNKSKRVTNLLKEPLLHFLLIGAALFVLYGWSRSSTSVPGGQAGTPKAQIVVTRDSLDRMNNLFAKTWQRQPTEEEQKALVEDLVRNEIYYREAIAIGLDRDDEVIRRRLRLKMEFIFEDINSLAEPTDADLDGFMKKHPDKYIAETQVAFRQVFVSKEKREKKAETDARQVLAQLTEGSNPDSVGDSTLLEPEVRLSPLSDIRKQFGDEFGKNLLELNQGRWEGPVPSGFGLHLVFVRERLESRLPDLNEVRDRVKLDWTAEKQKEMKDAAYARIRERYAVTVEKPRRKSASLAASTNTGVTVR